MSEATDRVTVFTQSSIRLSGEKMLYFDPFQMDHEPHDADAVFITHDHYDHFSPEDFAKVMRPDTVMVLPTLLEPAAREAGVPAEHIICVEPAQQLKVLGIPVETVAAYNVDKPYHPRSKHWVGYVVTVKGVRYFISGDTDRIPENEAVDCDVALIPIGGTFTMDAAEAAGLIDAIRPRIAAIPTHYGTIVGAPSDAAAFAKHVDPAIPVAVKLSF
ncbi:MAG: MBL fold metallo-hydrolase [Eggerthellaceae bacterium]|jgi:L-ascorbate metabolism protein UlaG (beta-lactamase superfamily)